MRRIFLQSTQKAWVKLVKNTQVHYTELYYRLQNEGSGDWWDLREKFLGISGYSSRMPALWFLAYFSYVNSFSMEMHTLESLRMLWLVWWTWTYFSFKKSTYLWRNNIFAIVFLFVNNDLFVIMLVCMKTTKLDGINSNL